MSTKTERKRRRQQERLAELPLWERARRHIPFTRIAVVAGVAAATVVAVVVLTRVSGGDAAKIVAPVRTGVGADTRVGIREGQLAPNFDAVDLTGKRVRLSDLRGQVVLLNFYASWCTGCAAEIPAIQRVWERYRGRGFTVLGVNDAESRSVAGNFLRSVGGQYNAVVDPTQTIADRYRVKGLPVSVFIDRTGLVQYYAPGELSESNFDKIASGLVARSTGGPLPAVTPVSTPAVR
ncbi:MAG: TlpA family protein disulfide reductase [Chloroflexota bacterium]|nr:TlpA family protein disulfide reductase [Chloroflexota bacterium]